MNPKLGLFETIKVVDGLAEFPDRHAERMAHSAQVFGLEFSREAFLQTVKEAAAACSGPHPWRLRIDRLPGNPVRWETKAAMLPQLPSLVTLLISEHLIDAENSLCRHKTTHRFVYTKAQTDAEQRGYWDSVLLNEKGQVAETGRANLFVWTDDALVTPPVSSGVLPGVVRQIILDRNRAATAVLGLDDLNRADAIFVTNSLIGIAGVTHVEGSTYAPDQDHMLALRAKLLSAIGSRYPIS